jgi:transposase
MSTSLLYHAFGIRGYNYVSTRYEGGGIIFTIRHNPESIRCPLCGSRDQLKKRGTVPRLFWAPNIGHRPVSIELAVQRVECPHCKVVRQVKLGFADPRRFHTKSFERFAVELSRHMTIKDVAAHLVVSWDVVKDIVKRYLHRRFAKPKLKKLRYIAIDEISVGKGHQYQTLVMDLETGAVVFVGDGKGVEALEPFWKRLKRSGARVRAVAMDMSPAYIAAVFKHLPKARIVFDHFHVIKMMNDKLSEFRRDLHRETENMLQKTVLKGTRWLLLKNPENLDEEHNERQRLEKALKLNRPLALAYYMKEDLRQLWKRESKSRAAKFLADWCLRAQASGIRFLIKFAGTLLAHRNGILSYYDHRISTGPLEGMNNKIKTMKRQAYGFRDKEFFKLKILGIHETKYALVG